MPDHRAAGLEQDVVRSVLNWVAPTKVVAIGAIGSYARFGEIRPGSDIDVVVVVEQLPSDLHCATLALYKYGRVLDPQGERLEFNSRLDNGTVVDVTLIDHFNRPNNPMRDYYENHLGWCGASRTLFGPHLRDVFGLEELVAKYEEIRVQRLELVEEKLASTKLKIREQGRLDLHVLVELQQFIFIREVIRSKKFNSQSIKHADDVIPGFTALFERELRDDCGIDLRVSRLDAGVPRTAHQVGS